MSGPTRRRMLTGVSTGAVFLSTGTGIRATAERDDDTRTDAGTGEDVALEVTIVETNAPVGAGDLLEVTAAVENVGASDVRTDVDLLVGDDFERVGRVRTTIDAGETTTLTQEFYTYPVPMDTEVPVRVDVAGDGAERTVNVIGATPLSDGRPDRDLAVQPGTEVLFEARLDQVDAARTTVWWVDGDRVGSPIGGPWQTAYDAETGFHYWREAFESPGTHDVAAAVVPEDGEETYAAHWTVEVADDGNASPTIDAYSPEPGERSYASGETATFELEVTDPDGELDRVVWWLTQADVLLDVTDLAGASDTARLSVPADRLCQTCRVVPWVICADGTVASPDETWRIGTVADDAGDERSD
ncbi:hypothetical protein ACFO5R_11550 [Halosolutus amylolyticus]|uniref:CARDB domain-containing protein n=1 Tax=Halosolutus amylolyticus TaxID=2932267 RepID=A0ABD5PQ29_9EURY|nr:hypothetical protein [Halosolutus amylolyticus]